MDLKQSRRSLKALSVAQPLKRQIDENLVKLELEKRKFLTNEREEQYLKDVLEKKKKQFNELRSQQPTNRTSSARTVQNTTSFFNIKRNVQQIYANIQTVKSEIETDRKNIFKYKKMNENLTNDINSLNNNCSNMRANIDELEENNENIKQEIITLREQNIGNLTQFVSSHKHLNKSNVREDHERKKFSMSQKNFLGEEFRNEKMVNLENLVSEDLPGSLNTEKKEEIMTNSIPLATQRIKKLIYNNKQKLRIAQSYKKFGDNLEQMFSIMKQYKGRDDIDFIAEEFVIKERQLQTIEQYIATLEARIYAYKNNLKHQKQNDEILKVELETKKERQDEKYVYLQEKLKNDVESLKRKEKNNTQWLQKISNLLMPITEQTLNRGNAGQLIGQIEEDLQIEPESPRKGTAKPSTAAVIEIGEKVYYNELFNYDKLRDFASDYVKTKKGTN